MSLTLLQKELGNLETEIRFLQPDLRFRENRKELVDKLEYIKCLARRYKCTFAEVPEPDTKKK